MRPDVIRGMAQLKCKYLVHYVRSDRLTKRGGGVNREDAGVGEVIVEKLTRRKPVIIERLADGKGYVDVWIGIGGEVRWTWCKNQAGR